MNVRIELQNQAAKARDSLIMESKYLIQRELDAARSKAAIAILEDARRNRSKIIPKRAANHEPGSGV
jgi:hypothetical protein